MNNRFPLVSLDQVLSERKEKPDPEALLSGDVRIVEKIGFNDGRIHLREEGATKTSMILIRPGDLVVSGINAAKGAIAIYGKDNTKPAAATIHYGAYAPDREHADIRYLWWLLRSRTFRELLLEHVPGGIKTELKSKRLLPVPVPLPSVSKQRRIVARIEELAARIEEARGLRLQAVEEAEAVLTSSITQALGSALIDGYLGGVLEAKPRNGWSFRCDNAEDGTPILSLGAVTGFKYRATEYKKTSEPTITDAHYWIRPGDLLITRSNTLELVGHAAIYSGSPEPCIYPDLMMRLSIDGNYADKRFVHYWLMSAPARDYIRKNAKGTSPSMKKISQGIVMGIPFPSSLSVKEQRRVVSYLDNLQAKVDSLKQLQAETAAELDALLPSVLDRGFKGEL